MSVVSRPNPLSLLLELTRRLAEEFHTVPIPVVTQTVQTAAAASQLFGDDVATSLPTIERIAREDLAAIRDAVGDQPTVAVVG